MIGGHDNKQNEERKKKKQGRSNNILMGNLKKLTINYCSSEFSSHTIA